MTNRAQVERVYSEASSRYAELGVDARTALDRLSGVAVSLHCWQGDDVAGFEAPDAELSGGGIQATGNYPGRARTPEELRADLDVAVSLIPGTHRLNLHAIYGEFAGQSVDRNEIGPEHFAGWTDWARQRGMGVDFNPTFFSHPLAQDGLTLSHSDEGVRRFWIEHAIACRRIGAHFGRALGTPCVTNLWIPDGTKDTPIDRAAPRRRLKDALDEIYAEPLDRAHNLDSLEGKLFGIGSESFVVGSHEFYLAYALANARLLCLDTGHYHPTEQVADKVSAVLTFLDEILLHVSRGVRWDSDHVVTFGDDVTLLAAELVRNDYLPRVHLGLDYFDASINRVAAWVIGTRAFLKALLLAMLEPTDRLRRMELEGDTTGRLALLEELKSLPFGAVWDYHCLQCGVPVGPAWLEEIRRYERKVLSQRQ
ncbi:MAG: L-rhamnose isomerase [Candidatus Brocadiaceae bacterium]|nr:L-rhamnose isomerase [Candidatus Brocadiaceae bacterium]